ncbi:MAG: diguanylate cyclase [Chitinivibrionales bacterium]|nr:diguanylate cyclase [Chitinivibrionales bacterium]
MSSNKSATTDTASFKALVVDDEQTLCKVLTDALKGKVQAASCTTGKQALEHIDRDNYDLLVLDLMLPDMTGIDILKYAKDKDEFVEALIVTGYASLESAAKAINYGASSYMVKPLLLDEFDEHIDRALANRAFHLKSLRLIESNEASDPEVLDHLHDLTTLYHFSRRLMVSLEIPEIIEIILRDANRRTQSNMCAVAINFLDFTELFIMPSRGALDEDPVRQFISRRWEHAFSFMSRTRFDERQIPLTIFPGRSGKTSDTPNTRPVSIPMASGGRTIGSLVFFKEKPFVEGSEEHQFLYVYSSLISSIVEHAYLDMRNQLLAKTDSLTGIANYRMFHEMLAREISRCNRRKNKFTLILIDIDDFKKVNDTYGHPVGNHILKDMTQRILGEIRKGDLLARYGGEEFVLILPETDILGAQIMAERTRAAIADKPYTSTAHAITYTISLGVSVYDGTKPRTKDELISNADKALYLSKGRGKNRVTVE